MSDRSHRHDGPHVISAKTLVATFGALIMLTALTVGATWVDLGASGNVVVAMVIATIKALIVALVFMHLWYDQKFNLIILFVSVLTVVLFVTVTFIDVAHYKPGVDAFEDARTQPSFVEPPKAPAPAPN